MFDKKLKRVKPATQISLVVPVVLIIYSFHLFSQSQNTKDMLVHTIIILILAESTVLVKLWYWVLNAKYGMLKEIKQLQLQIAELSGKEPPTED